jgi:hypothetical protein
MPAAACRVSRTLLVPGPGRKVVRVLVTSCVRTALALDGQPLVLESLVKIGDGMPPVMVRTPLDGSL